ncbi:uncharacterized protein CLUP02_03878 [Colletotrichum lupini]|uniref:Uncharacterized protein n=1 Tax=Colletotrichum lupini TaxID=145971 RepID=A0A9Q8SK56_9PEZI|nr:uncharacterized protein CLUP02_03878 [Colletotrichum lupini]UQC78401.1 hypothetical protein CLUP02_03878 [Colletotrichum lupini]
MALGVWGVCYEIWMWLMLPILSGPAFCDRFNVENSSRP